jgi:inner membrane protein
MVLDPYPVNPFRWHAILETEDYYQTAEINTRTGEIVSDPSRDVIYKPPVTAATEAAKRTLLGQVYMDWGVWAMVSDLGPVAAPGMAPPQVAPGRQWTTVAFSDLRFGYPILGGESGRRGGGGRAPLAGWVYIVDGRDEAGESMNGREQR